MRPAIRPSNRIFTPPVAGRGDPSKWPGMGDGKLMLLALQADFRTEGLEVCVRFLQGFAFRASMRRAIVDGVRSPRRS